MTTSPVYNYYGAWLVHGIFCYWYFPVISEVFQISQLFLTYFPKISVIFHILFISQWFLFYFSLISQLFLDFSLVSQYFSVVCHLRFVFVKPLLPDLLKLSSLKASYIASFCYDFGAITEAVNY